jgi:hypothetical protein
MSEPVEPPPVTTTRSASRAGRSALLTWRKHGLNATIAHTGFDLQMHGTYTGPPDDYPSWFYPFETFEKRVRKVLHKLHLATARSLPPSKARDTGAGEFESDPNLQAPPPYRDRGKTTIRFRDDLQNASNAYLTVLFPGTAQTVFNPEGKVSSTGIGGSAVKWTRAVTVGVDSDPEVSISLVSGEELAAYFDAYLRRTINDFVEPLSLGPDFSVAIDRAIGQLTNRFLSGPRLDLLDQPGPFLLGEGEERTFPVTLTADGPGIAYAALRVLSDGANPSMTDTIAFDVGEEEVAEVSEDVAASAAYWSEIQPRIDLRETLAHLEYEDRDIAGTGTTFDLEKMLRPRWDKSTENWRLGGPANA